MLRGLAKFECKHNHEGVWFKSIIILDKSFPMSMVKAFQIGSGTFFNVGETLA